jgi:hypothetical protein
MNITIGTITSEVKDYTFPEFIDAIKAIKAPKGCSLKYALAENSYKSDYFKQIRRHFNSAEHIKVNPDFKTLGPNTSFLAKILAYSHDMVRKMAYDYRSEWLLHIESDIIPEPDTLLRLLQAQKEVVGGWYFIGDDVQAFPNVHLSFQDYNGGESAIRLDEHWTTWATGNVVPVHSVGLGCLLIHQSVFHKIGFRYEVGVHAYPDSFFANDCRFKNIQQWCDSSLLLKHNFRNNVQK